MCFYIFEFWKGRGEHRTECGCPPRRGVCRLASEVLTQTCEIFDDLVHLPSDVRVATLDTFPLIAGDLGSEICQQRDPLVQFLPDVGVLRDGQKIHRQVDGVVDAGDHLAGARRGLASKREMPRVCAEVADEHCKDKERTTHGFLQLVRHGNLLP